METVYIVHDENRKKDGFVGESHFKTRGQAEKYAEAFHIDPATIEKAEVEYK